MVDFFLVDEYADTHEWAEGMTKEEKAKVIEAANFCQKADWEGGFDEVADQWPDMVPADLKWAAERFTKAKNEWETAVDWYLKHAGVEY